MSFQSVSKYSSKIISTKNSIIIILYGFRLFWTMWDISLKQNNVLFSLL